MAVITRSHFELARARKALQKAFDAGNWQAVAKCDKSLGASLNSAFDDSQVDSVALVYEMERIIHLYAEVLDELPAAASAIAAPPSSHLE